MTTQEAMLKKMNPEEREEDCPRRRVGTGEIREPVLLVFALTGAQ